MVLKITLSEVAGPEIGRRGRREGMGRPGFRGGQKPHRASLYFGQVLRAFSGSIPTWPQSIPFGHDCGSRFRGPSPEERALHRSGSGVGSYSRKVTHGPLE